MVVTVLNRIGLVPNTGERWIIVLAPGHGEGQLAAEIGVSAEQVCQGRAAFAPAVVIHDDRVRMVFPFIKQNSAAGIQRHDYFFTGVFKGLDQGYFFRFQPEACAVAAFRFLFERVVGGSKIFAFFFVIAAQAEQNHTGVLGRLYRRLCVHARNGGYTGKYFFQALQGSNDPIVKHPAGTVIPGIRFGGVGAAHRDCCVFCQGQHAVIFQQHHAFFSRFPGQCAVFGAAHHAHGAVLDIRRLPYQRPQDIADGAVKVRGAEFPLFEQFFDFPRGVMHGEHHFHVQTGAQGVFGVPDAKHEIAHHKTVKAPFIAQNTGKQFLIFTAVEFVKAVIRAHNALRPCLNTFFEMGQVDFV